jgi:hypothetical protein
MTFVRREYRETTGGGRDGNGDIFEAGIVCASAVKDCAAVAGFLDAKWQDAPG